MSENYRIQPQDVCMTEAMQFGQHWEVRIPIQIGEIPDLGLALQSVASRLRSGDKITVCAFKDKRYNVLTEVAEYRVVGTGRAVRIFKTMGPVKVPLVLREEAEEASVVLRVEPLGSSFVAVDPRGNHIESFGDREQAQNFVDRENKRPVQTKAA